MSGRECSSCGARLAGGSTAPSDDGGLGYVIPMNVEPCSTIAGYLGLFSVVFVFLGPFAVILGVWGLRRIANDGRVKGKSRAWTGIVLGTIGTLLMLLIVYAVVTG